ncbi:COX15/CtaA family protein [Flavobacteriaceae bacterium F08102]|nr:COX15/CtaA family protein [Flavobacteriaceae bacterium F08102]
MKLPFTTLVKICIFSVYLIILAGATVRMTGSGMGCPDWPKCFGHLIPPTSEEQITWKPNTDFKKGYIIIHEDQLWVSQKAIHTEGAFNRANWEVYTKHDYASFNATHTWVEYINRLTSAVAGVFFLWLIIRSFAYRKSNKWIPILSFLALGMMLFEAWLGKTVVDSNLSVTKISVHMLVALAIVAVLLIILKLLRTSKVQRPYNALMKWMVFVALLTTIVQVLLGIEIRQYVDIALKEVGLMNKHHLNLSEQTYFLVHRSFSIFVVLINLLLVFKNRKLNLGYRLPNWIMIFLGIEILTGIIMYYADFPFGTQATHLLFATFLFGLQFYLLLQTSAKQHLSLRS